MSPQQQIQINLSLEPKAAVDALPAVRREAVRVIMEMAVTQIRAALERDEFARQVVGR